METITNKQSFAIIVSFMLCNAFSVLFGTDCGKNVWIAYALAAVLAVFIWHILSSLCERRNFNSFFEMLTFTFGRIGGVVLSSILALYALLSCTTSISLFGKFVQISSLPKTPLIVLPVILLVIATLSLKSGGTVFSRCSVLFFPFLIFTFVIFIFFGLPQLNFQNITPILENNVLPTLKSSLTVFTSQFGDALILFAIYPLIIKNPKRKKISLGAIIAATALASIIALFTILTLGEEQMKGEFFPVFTILSIRKVGAYIQHMEILTSVAMTFSVFIRQAVCLYFISLALSHVLKTESYKSHLIPPTLIIAAGTYILYRNIMSLKWRVESDLNIYILLPLQFVLPCLMALIFTLKRKKEK